VKTTLPYYTSFRPQASLVSPRYVPQSALPSLTRSRTPDPPTSDNLAIPADHVPVSRCTTAPVESFLDVLAANTNDPAMRHARRCGGMAGSFRRRLLLFFFVFSLPLLIMYNITDQLYDIPFHCLFLPLFALRKGDRFRHPIKISKVTSNDNDHVVVSSIVDANPMVTLCHVNSLTATLRKGKRECQSHFSNGILVW